MYKRQANLIEALKRLDSFELTEVSQSHPIVGNMRWKVEQVLGDVLWKLGRYQEAYYYYLQCFPRKPINSDRWPPLLNSLCALAIEFEDQKQMPDLFKALLLNHATPLDLYFLRVDQLENQNRLDEAKQFLQWGMQITSRIKGAPEYEGYQARLLSP